jgi:hypothetical protein
MEKNLLTRSKYKSGISSPHFILYPGNVNGLEMNKINVRNMSTYKDRRTKRRNMMKIASESEEITKIILASLSFRDE